MAPTTSVSLTHLGDALSLTHARNAEFFASDSSSSGFRGGDGNGHIFALRRVLTLRSSAAPAEKEYSFFADFALHGNPFEEPAEAEGAGEAQNRKSSKSRNKNEAVDGMYSSTKSVWMLTLLMRRWRRPACKCFHHIDD